VSLQRESSDSDLINSKCEIGNLTSFFSGKKLTHRLRYDEVTPRTTFTTLYIWRLKNRELCGQYQCCFVAMVFENCSAKPRDGNILTSPEFTLVSDQELTFTMGFLPFDNYSSVNVYKTSVLGRIATLLGSYPPPWNNSDAVNITHSICLPAGTYQLAFIASDVENATKSTAVLREVSLSNFSCTYTSLAGKATVFSLPLPSVCL